jgi:hypothetical protein
MMLLLIVASRQAERSVGYERGGDANANDGGDGDQDEE